MTAPYPSFRKVGGSKSLKPKAKSERNDSDNSQSGWGDWGNDDFDEGTPKGSDADEKDNEYKQTSAYQWGDSGVSPDSDEFFSDIITKPAKPSKKLTQPSRKSRTALAAKKEENFDGASDRDGGKADDGWGWNDDWTDPNEGLSKAEQMKKQREEKRRQRQEELQKKRAARASGPGSRLGARKMD